MSENLKCDGSGPHAAGVVKKMPAGGGGNFILCRLCWDFELQFRRRWNVSHDDSQPFELPAWETAEVYEC